MTDYQLGAMALAEPEMETRRGGGGYRHMLLAGRRVDAGSPRWTWVLEERWHQAFIWASQCPLAGPISASCGIRTHDPPPADRVLYQRS